MAVAIEPWVFVAIAAAVCVGAAAQGLVGLGVGLVAAPVTTMLEPDLMPGVLLWLAAAMPVVTLLRERDRIDWRGLAWAVPARIPGTVVGVGLVAAFAESQLGVAVALIVLAAVALTVRTVTWPVTPGTLATAGFVSGVTGTATSIGGPPLALLYQHRHPREIRCTLAVYFLLGALLSLGGLAVGGQLAWRDLGVAVLLLPALVAGFGISRVLHRHVDTRHLRAGILLVCSAGAVVLLVRSLL